METPVNETVVSRMPMVSSNERNSTFFGTHTL